MKVENNFENSIKVEFKCIQENESLARLIIASFILPLNPSLEEMNDIKTSVSEAVTNAIVHGYDMDSTKEIILKANIHNGCVLIEVIDYGKGIEDISKAKEPLFTTRPELERSGLGFTIMDSFMDELNIISKVGSGTTITMKKKISNHKEEILDE